MACAREAPMYGTVSSWVSVAVLRLTGFDVVALTLLEVVDLRDDDFFDETDDFFEVEVKAAVVSEPESDSSSGDAVSEPPEDDAKAEDELICKTEPPSEYETASEVYSATAETSVLP
jgi:hypothetical protein